MDFIKFFNDTINDPKNNPSANKKKNIVNAIISDIEELGGIFVEQTYDQLLFKVSIDCDACNRDKQLKWSSDLKEVGVKLRIKKV